MGGNRRECNSSIKMCRGVAKDQLWTQKFKADRFKLHNIYFFDQYNQRWENVSNSRLFSSPCNRNLSSTYLSDTFVKNSLVSCISMRFTKITECSLIVNKIYTCIQNKFIQAVVFPICIPSKHHASLSWDMNCLEWGIIFSLVPPGDITQC